MGIGKAIATLFASEGAHLVLSDVDDATVQATAAEISKEKGVKTLGVKANVAQIADCEKAVEQSLDKFGRIDILINNAGITRDNLLMRMSDEEWDAVLAVNLKGVFNCTKAVVRPMMKARKGRIVNIASVVGLMGNAGQANYAASKGGVMLMMQTLAQEVAPSRIRVNSIAPGAIRTPINTAAWQTPQAYEALMTLVPYKRIGEPDDVARAAVWLASDDSDYVVGATLFVDGGMTLCPCFAEGG